MTVGENLKQVRILVGIAQDADDRYPVAADLLGDISVEILCRYHLDFVLGCPRSGMRGHQ